MYLEDRQAAECVLLTCEDQGAACTPTIVETGRRICNGSDKNATRYNEDNEDGSDSNDDEQFGETRMPEEMRFLLRAVTERLPDDGDMPPLPEWLDVRKLRAGQAFGSKYLYGLNYSQTLSLLLLFAYPDGLTPLIYTEKSHTPHLAFERYLSTALKVKSWYETEIWKPTSEGYKNLRSVRRIHLSVSNHLNNTLKADEIRRRSDLKEKLKNCATGAMLCPLSGFLERDFDAAAAAVTAGDRRRQCQRRHVYFNQLEMCLTQFGFYGLMLLYPDKFAAKNATEEELECFVHLWRYIGYMLGIADRYNICGGRLDEVRRKSAMLVEYSVRPAVLRAAANKQWEHMARCAFRGIEKFTKLTINFEATMLYFCWVLGIPTPHLENYVGWKETALFNLTRLIMTEGYKVPGFATFFNYRVRRNIEEAAAAKTRQ